MIIIGHRGARGLAPENTIASIKKAMEIGVDEVEIDVRITRDGIPILSHESSITTDTKVMAIATHTLAELRSIKPDVGTLEEALKLSISRSVPLQVEVKYGESTDTVISTIQRQISLTRKLPPVLLASKSQKILVELHQAFPDLPTVVIEPWSGVRAGYRARQLGTRRISMRSWWLWKGFLQSMARRGYQISPYTMNKPAKILKWQPYIYGVVTDYPDRFPR
jgi:glycerophosphoryl diester phosphodiesterase